MCEIKIPQQDFALKIQGGLCVCVCVCVCGGGGGGAYLRDTTVFSNYRQTSKIT